MSIVTIVKTFFSELESAAGESGTSLFEQPLVVGVSGGPDSVALLHALSTTAAYPGGKIMVAHLNHMLRPSAAAEASYVASLAEAWQLPFRTRAVAVGDLARREGLSLETAGRRARYAFLADVAREFNADYIATGHNQNDQAETVLMHFIRGSGLTGLRGMQAVSAVPGAPDMTLLRPLLAASRASIAAYCAENNLHTVDDESNTDISLLRNRIRHELLPTLAAYNPQIVARLDTLSRVVDADESLLAQMLDTQWREMVVGEGATHLSLDLQRWRALPLSIRRRSLRRAAVSLRPELSDLGYEATELAREVAEQGKTGDQMMLPGQVNLSVGYEALIFTTPEHRPGEDEWPQLPGEDAYPLAVPGAVQLAAGWQVRAELVRDFELEHIVQNPDRWRAYINVAFADDLAVRPWRAGERLRPLGMNGRSTKIGDIMTDRKIAKKARPLWPLVASQQHPLWLAGHVLDERGRVQPGDKDALLVRVERPQIS